MKIGERGQVTIPKGIRERFGLGTATEVEFVVEGGEIVLRKKLDRRGKGRRRRIESCIGVLRGRPEDVDQFIEDIRGR